MKTLNTREDGTRLYGISYVEPICEVYAHDEQQALERYLVYCQKNDFFGLYTNYGNEDDDSLTYVDPTMEDPSCSPAYLRTDYLRIEEIASCVDAGGHPKLNGWG